MGWQSLALVGLLTFVLTLGLAALIDVTNDGPSCGDCIWYRQMGDAPWMLQPAPWGYRIAVPFVGWVLTRVLAADIRQVFGGLTYVGFALVNTTLLLWAWRGLRLRLGYAAAATSFYAFSYAVATYLETPIHIGLYEHLAVLLGFMAIYHRRFYALVGVLLVGMLVKETVAILIPVYAVTALWEERLRALPRVGMLTVVAAVPFFALRSGVLFADPAGLGTYTSFYTLAYVREVAASYGGYFNAARKIALASPVLIPLSVLGFLYAPPRDRLLAIIVPLAWMQILLATDVERVAAIGFPGTTLLLASLLRRLNAREVLAWTLLSIANFYLYIHVLLDPRMYDRVRDVNEFLRFLPIAFVGTYAAILVWFLWGVRRRLTQPPALERPGG